MIKKDSILKKLMDDTKAQVFTLDALLALILITIVIGMSANAMDIVGFKIADYSSGRSLDRITTDAAEILVNTPGSSDWENTNSTSGVTPGLAENDDGSENSTKILSMKKIAQLRNKYSALMDNILPKSASSSLIIYPAGSASDPILLNNQTPPTDASEIAVVNRTVLVNFKDYRILTYICTSLLSNASSGICPHHNLKEVNTHEKPDFNNRSTGWNCKCFKITQQDVNTTDFYLITDPPLPNDVAARWTLDRSDKISEESKNFQSSPLLVNEVIQGIVGDDRQAVIWLHIFTSGDSSKSLNVYLVAVPKGTSAAEVKIENLNPQPCFLILRVWMD